MLRNTPTAGWEQWELQAGLWVMRNAGAPGKGLGIGTRFAQPGHGDSSQVTEHSETAGADGAAGRALTMARTRCEGTNIQGVPKRLQLELFLCYCAMVKLL